jgi:hypothetical protein
MTADTYPFNYVEPPGPPEKMAGRWREAPADGNRFQLINFPPLPGKCAACGYSGGTDSISSTYERMFIDLGFDVDYYGTIVFCTTCVIEMGSVLGFVTPTVANELRDKVSSLTASNQELGLANNQLRGALNVLTSVSSVYATPVDSDKIKPESTGEAIGTESTASKLSLVKGRGNVSSITSRSDNNDGLDI